MSTAIEWTESTWNPVVGCTKVSAGCANCYAERMAKRLARMARADIRKGNDPGKKRHYTGVVNTQGKWNFKVKVIPEALDEPLHWRKSRLVFVCSMGDLFHSKVPYRTILDIWRVMERTPQHQYQVLTKRPNLMARRIGGASGAGLSVPPLPNVWLGTTVENGDETWRVDYLKACPAAVRFLSLEPLLGPVDVRPHLDGIDWVIVGGESGPGARPMYIDWVTRIRDDCVSAGVPFFFKQRGGVNKKKNGRLLDGRTWDEMPEVAP